MSRLADQLLEGPPRRPAGAYQPPERMREAVLAQLRETMAETPVFVIDNVDAYWQRTGKGAGPFTLADFPNVAPPFHSFFMEWRLHDEDGRPRPDPDARIGALFTVLDDLPDGGWRMDVIPFLGGRGGAVGPVDILYVETDASGRITDLRGTKDADEHRTPEEARNNWGLVQPALLGVCFLHCRNVATDEIVPPAGTAKARAKRGKRPLLRYRVLRIEPMTSVLRTEGGVETEGLARALHICRGHFKTYEERPLFGRLRGTWWWGDQVRGAAESGEVVKDYDVRAPSASPEDVRAAATRKQGRAD